MEGMSGVAHASDNFLCSVDRLDADATVVVLARLEEKVTVWHTSQFLRHPGVLARVRLLSRPDVDEHNQQHNHVNRGNHHEDVQSNAAKVAYLRKKATFESNLRGGEVFIGVEPVVHDGEEKKEGPDHDQNAQEG